MIPPDLNIVDNKGFTPLYYTAEYGHNSIINLLFEKGARLDWYAAYICVAKGHYETTKLFIDLGFDVKNTGRGSQTILERAVQSNRLNIADLLLKHGAKLGVPKCNNPLIFSAINTENPQMVSLIITAGVDVNQHDRLEKTPLSQAFFLKNFAIAKILLDAGADPNLFNSYSNSLLREACAGNQGEMAMLLIQYGALVDVPGPNRDTALQHMIKHKNIHLIRMLLDKGVDLKRILSNKQTYLGYACSEYAPCEILDMLIAAGADVEQGGDNYNKPLIVACRVRANKVIKFFLQRGADPNHPIYATSHTTPLNIAIYRRNESIVTLLLDAGADPNMPQIGGSTPLHKAACHNSQHITRILIAAGADINKTDNLKKTPLHYAVQYGYEKVAEVLLLAGASPKLADYNGRTAEECEVIQKNAKLKVLFDQLPLSLQTLCTFKVHLIETKDRDVKRQRIQ